MKQFILRSLIVLVCAIIFVVVVFVLLQFYLSSSPKEVVNDVVSSEPIENESVENKVVDDVPPPEGSIPLNTLPLSDTQKSTLETFGVDVETFVITSEMIDCGREALGSTRIDEIIAGAAPSVAESLELVKCTKE
jgi:hypothetical protein